MFYFYAKKFPENSRQEILYELGLNFEEINFIINLPKEKNFWGWMFKFFVNFCFAKLDLMFVAWLRPSLKNQLR